MELNFSEILGHCIDDKVQSLIKEVCSYYTYKKLLIHPISLAKEELGENYSININGISKPSLNRYIGIWINENLPTIEFNIILAEELCHHIQAYNKFPAIFGLIENEFVFTFRNLLNSTIWDLNTRHHLLDRSFDLTPLQKLDYNEAIKSIDIITSEQLYQFSLPTQNYIFFPQYLLWWYDLVFLSSSFKEKWEKNINQWFLKNTPYQTQKKWASLILFIKENPISSSYSVKTSITEICRELIERMPIFISANTEGMEIKLAFKDLVPRTQV